MARRIAQSSTWADPDLEIVLELEDRSKAVGWRAALAEIEAVAPFFAHRMRNLSLGNWQLLIEGPKDQLLDIGCGFGSLALGSGAFAKTAVGLDALQERVQYGHLRATQDHADNVRFSVGSGLELPFSSKKFDIVTFNGVLEWAGLFATGEPIQLQQAMLREATRVLRSTGTVAVAIENTLAAETLLGLRDTHTGTHWMTSLPHPLSGFLLRLRLGKDPRVRLHSRRGYTRLIRRAGIPYVRALNLIPSYNNYQYVLLAEDITSHRFVHENLNVMEFYQPARRARRWAAVTAPAILPTLAYAYLMLAGNDEQRVLLDPDAPIWVDLEVDHQLPRFAVQMEVPGSIGVLVHDGNRPTHFLKLWAARVGEPAIPETVRTNCDWQVIASKAALTPPLVGCLYRAIDKR